MSQCVNPSIKVRSRQHHTHTEDANSTSANISQTSSTLPRLGNKRFSTTPCLLLIDLQQLPVADRGDSSHPFVVGQIAKALTMQRIAPDFCRRRGIWQKGKTYPLSEQPQNELRQRNCPQKTWEPAIFAFALIDLQQLPVADARGLSHPLPQKPRKGHPDPSGPPNAFLPKTQIQTRNEVSGRTPSYEAKPTEEGIQKTRESAAER